MAPLTWNVRDTGTRIIIALRGELTLSGTTDLHTRLMKCLAEQPTALLVDLSEMTVTDDLALSVFTAVVRQAALWPGTPVQLCAATAPVNVRAAAGCTVNDGFA